MKRILTIYPNCSLGGMTSVYIGRCIAQPNTQFDHLFVYDKGGRQAFGSPANSDYRIVRKDRIQAYYGNVLRNIHYDEIRITSYPQLTHVDLENNKDTKLVYEFHSSTVSIIEAELKELNLEKINEIWVPSEYLQTIVLGLLSEGVTVPVRVVANIANTQTFYPPCPEETLFHFEKGTIPVFWVGRLDKGKNYKDFIRAFSLLPKKYHGFIVLSLESEPERISEALLEVESFNLGGRIKFLLNLTQEELARLYRDSTKNRGIFVSTSLAESFGYGVLEAALCGLPVVTYEVGGISGHKKYGFAMHMIDVGDTVQLAKQIRNLDWDCDHNQNIHMYECYLKKFQW